MLKPQSMLNIAAYATLSLAGLGSGMLPTTLPGVAPARPAYVEVPKVVREHAATRDDAALVKAVAWSDRSAPNGGAESASTWRTEPIHAGRE